MSNRVAFEPWTRKKVWPPWRRTETETKNFFAKFKARVLARKAEAGERAKAKEGLAVFERDDQTQAQPGQLETATPTEPDLEPRTLEALKKADTNKPTFLLKTFFAQPS